MRHFAGTAAILFGLVLAAHCGGATASHGGGDGGTSSGGSGGGTGSSGSGSGSSGSGSSSGSTSSGSSSGTVICAGSGHGTPAETPSSHRPALATCERTVGYGYDAGSVSCDTDADCQGDSGNPTLHCAEHACGYDECLMDGDCGSGTICVCSSDVGGGDGIHANRCIAANCTADGDCGAGNYCVPSRGYCGGVEGYYCTSGSDTCVDPQTDCACGGDTCQYAPEIGHFACAATTCSG